MNYRLPGPDFGGLKSFAFQLVADEQGSPMILSNEVIELYLGYCVERRKERADILNFSSWLNSDREAEPYTAEVALDAGSADAAQVGAEPVSST